MGSERRIYSPGIITSPLCPLHALAQRIVYRHQLCAVRKGRLDLHLSEHFWHPLHDLIAAQNLSSVAHQLGHGLAITGPFQQLRTDERHRLRVIELEPPPPPPPRHLRRDKDEEFVDFTWCQMHTLAPSPRLPLTPSAFTCARPPPDTLVAPGARHPTPRAAPHSLPCGPPPIHAPPYLPVRAGWHRQ